MEEILNLFISEGSSSSQCGDAAAARVPGGPVNMLVSQYRRLSFLLCQHLLITGASQAEHKAARLPSGCAPPAGTQHLNLVHAAPCGEAGRGGHSPSAAGQGQAPRGRSWFMVSFLGRDDVLRNTSCEPLLGASFMVSRGASAAR